MATELQPDFEDQSNSQSQSPQQTLTSDAGSGSPTNSQNGQQSFYVAKPQQRSASSGFTNLKQYLGANENNTLGSGLAQDAQNKLDTSKQSLNQSYGNYQNEIADQQSKINTNAQGAQDSLNYLDTGIPQNSVDNNDKALKTLQDANQYTFGGTKSLGDIQNLYNDRVGLQDYADQTAKESGRAAILQNKYGQSGNYTGGMQNLDNLILSNDKGALDQLRNIRAQTRNYVNDVQNKELSAQTQNASTTSDLGNEKDYINKQSNDLYGSLKQRLQDQADTYNAAEQADASNLSPEELTRMLASVGYTPQALDPQHPSNVDLATTNIPQNWVDLRRNSQFTPDQQYTAQGDLSQNSIDAGGLFDGGDHPKTKLSPDNPAQVDTPILVQLDALRKFFNQSYNNTDWTGIDADTLARRNVLNQFLGSNAPDGGPVQATAKNTVQDVVDQQNIDTLKSLPKLAYDTYKTDFTSRPNSDTLISDILKNPTKYGYQGTWDAAQALRNGSGSTYSFGDGYKDYFNNPTRVVTPGAFGISPFGSLYDDEKRGAANNAAKIASNQTVSQQLQQLGLTPDQYKLLMGKDINE